LALQPVTYRPITPIKPVSRKSDDEAVRKAKDRKPPKNARKPDPGTGENLDLWV
jgi:hypothetical protein